MLQAWVDGELVAADQARVSVFDRGFRTGEGVFETFRVYHDHVFRRDAHLTRATEGAEVLGFRLDHDRLAAAVDATTAANHAAHRGTDSVVRLTATPGALDPMAAWPSHTVDGPTVVVTSHRLVVDEREARDGVAAVVVPWARELPDIKAVSYVAASMARRRARDQGADEALLTDPAGDILEGASSNVFAVLAGRLVTPPTSAGLLAGVTRAVVLEVADELGIDVEQRSLSVEMLTAADEAFLTATIREVVPLVRLGDRVLGAGRPGPVTAALREGYRTVVERERAAQT